MKGLITLIKMNWLEKMIEFRLGPPKYRKYWPIVGFIGILLILLKVLGYF